MKKSTSLLIDIGFGNTVVKSRILSITAYDSDPVIRHCRELENTQKVIDATKGRKTKSVLFLDSGHVVLSALTRETLADKM